MLRPRRARPGLSLAGRHLPELSATGLRLLRRSAIVGDNASIPAPAPMSYLVVREPGQVSYTLSLREGLRRRRHEQNDIVLDDHQGSRLHARLSPGLYRAALHA